MRGEGWERRLGNLVELVETVGGWVLEVLEEGVSRLEIVRESGMLALARPGRAVSSGVRVLDPPRKVSVSLIRGGVFKVADAEGGDSVIVDLGEKYVCRS